MLPSVASVYLDTNISKLPQAYGDSVLSRAQAFRWFKAFSEGRESIEDEPHSGRSSVSETAENVIRVQDLARSDRRVTSSIVVDPHLSIHDKFYSFTSC
ncbi:uncharacterized protein TNCV_312191 [Trichonephila clavipes]|nr:uncharacterized protein TNCV_312191 [Trichonephila clavipes]